MRQPIPFGKYYLLERVNVGGMAEVFKAKATGVEGFERLVALKRILPNIAEDEEFITMFVDEAKIAVQLTHANIAQIFDLGKVADSYFIALEYIRGKDLRAIFNRCRSRGEPMPIPLCCYALMKVCEGLDYAHQKRDANGTLLNLVHRDVSPQNLLVSYEGEVKIIDFGIAKAAGKVGRTQAGILKGKFGYMSPEQIEGLEIDRRSDIFGLGICLYEMLTGERLFVAETDFATLEKVKKVEIMPPSTYNRRITPELERIVLTALAKDRDQRHQTALELHDDLRAYMHEAGIGYGRAELATFMRRLFSEEIERENQRDRSYSDIGLPPAEHHEPAAASLRPVGPRPRAPTLSGSPPLREASSASRRGRLPSGVGMSRPPAAMPFVSANGGRMPSAPPTGMHAPPSGMHPSRTGMHAAQTGMPASPTGLQPAPRSRPRAMPTPTPTPSRSTRPPRVPPIHPRTESIPAPAAAAPRMRTASEMNLEWDDEELSTQIYDKPEELMEAMAAVRKGPERPMSMPPTLQAADYGLSDVDPPGEPAPFAAEPQPVPLAPPSTETFPARPVESGHSAQGRTLWLVALTVAAIVSVIVITLALSRSPDELGRLQVRTLPGNAHVFLDGVRVDGNSPFLVEEVSAGDTHELTISMDGYHPWSSKVLLEPGQTVTIPQVSLDPLPTGFAIDSIPRGAEVYLDGAQTKLKTPARFERVPPGEHQIRLVLEGYRPWSSATIDVDLGTLETLPTITLGPEGEGDQGDESAASDSGASAGRAANRRGTAQGSGLDGAATERKGRATPPPAVSSNLRPDQAVGAKSDGTAAANDSGKEGKAVESPPVAAPVAAPDDVPNTADNKADNKVKEGSPSPTPDIDDLLADATDSTDESETGVREDLPPAPTPPAATAPPAAVPAPATPGDAPANEDKSADVRTGVLPHGFLRINARPWVVVIVDGQRIGPTPQLRIPVAPGLHQVQLINEEFGIDERAEIEVAEGKTESRVFNFQR